MTETDRLIYLEPDDEITGVVRRVRGAGPGRVVIVAPPRSRITGSLAALRLLARMAADEGRQIALVADPTGRALAAEAGIAAHASVEEAGATAPPPLDGEVEPAALPPARAPIHVVRGSGAADETTAVPVARPAASRSALTGTRRAPRSSRLAWRWPAIDWRAYVALAAGVALLALVLLPGATIRITAATSAIDPVHYTLDLPPSGTDSGRVTLRRSGTATGERLELVPATGAVVFYNWNALAIQVPSGTGLAADRTEFVTTETVVVPGWRFVGLELVPGTQSAAVAAVEPGASGNVAAEAIDTITDSGIRNQLRVTGSNPNRLVSNPEPTSGGEEVPHPVIDEVDVAALVATIGAQLADDLDRRLADHDDRIYADASSAEEAVVEVPENLVGTEDQPTFTLVGELAYERAYVLLADLRAAATQRLLADPDAAPPGKEVIVDSMELSIDGATSSGSTIAVSVTVDASAAPRIDGDAVRERVAGLTAAAAAAALSDLGTVEVELWPAWVDRVPGIGLRVAVESSLPDASPAP